MSRPTPDEVGAISKSPVRSQRYWGSIAVTAGVAACVHLVAALVFATLVVARIDGCDAGDGAVAALAAAVVVDALLTGVAVAFLLARRRDNVLVGFAIASVPALVGLMAAAGYVHSLGTGCPV